MRVFVPQAVPQTVPQTASPQAASPQTEAPQSPGRLLGSVLGFALLGLALLVLGGCGYALVGQASNLPEDVRDIYVEPLENKTPRSQVEQILTEAVIDELVTRRRFSVVNERSEADAILRGSIVDFRLRPLTFDATGLASDFEITITADMRLERQPEPGDEAGEVLWENSRYVFREDYPVSDTGLTFFDRENLAIEETAEPFAETLVTDLLEGF
ncbi:MAG: LptE family protein [Acidobacteriota bacterium]